MKPTPCLLLAMAALALAWAGCAHRAGRPSANVLPVPLLAGAFVVDGNLDEPCYRNAPAVHRFLVAGDATRPPAATAAWLFWSPDGLHFAFDCDDTNLVVAPPSANERGVDPQDRVELFLWSGRSADRYYCIEIAASGAVHDYAARFYRQFDDSWAPRGWDCAVQRRAGGYRVEARLSRAALEAMGFSWRAGTPLRAGLFRADFTAGKPDAPDWIAWVDARTPQPDFHVAQAFGTLTFELPTAGSPARSRSRSSAPPPTPN